MIYKKRLLYFGIWFLICSILGGAAVFISHILFWAGFLIAAFALFANSLLADFEDRLPGGFLNPKGNKKE